MVNYISSNFESYSKFVESYSKKKRIKDRGITEAEVEATVAKTSKDKKGLEFSEIKEGEKKKEKMAGPVNSVKQGAAEAGAKLAKDEKGKLTV
ncbi:hypothetical protein AVEN_221041-1 [Araneus ventricosus]|uniref:Uncharacterized protein n=1 Tax=Araneus ventricosus TaxID=182803 RepID=A0A4Y2WMH2_ARAVE|nr:hypothetical protein AVEN_221041-1 [Araneus ventricosus]